MRMILLVSSLSLLFSCGGAKIMTIDTKPPERAKVLKGAVKTLKRKVAIARFSNETNYGKGFFSGENRLGKQAMDILSAQLVKTGKFLLLERSDLSFLNSERTLQGLDSLSIGSDYIIVGSVTEFGRGTTSEVGVFSRSKEQKAHAKVSIRLIDVRTGLIIYSEEGSGDAIVTDTRTLGLGGRSGYNSEINDRAISAAISKLVNNIVDNLMKQEWRSYILFSDKGNLIISGGKTQGIKAGDLFNIVKRGKKVKNPQTGLIIELPGKIVAVIEVIDTMGNIPIEEISNCKVKSGDAPLKNFGEYYITEKKGGN